ncbi:MAG TPA: ATP-binding protein, partial [Verrucomicrobiae bacterium]
TLRLVKNMADRMAHEIGNALVPLSTHQQLLADKYKDPEFRASLDNALAEGVKRISRLTTQMRFLARDSLATPETLPLNQLIEESFAEAKKHYPSKSAKLKQDASELVVLSGDHVALRHAMAEVMLNALQANPAESIVEVSSTTDSDISGMRWVHIDVHDRGGGFPAENLSRLPQPFFTTRNVGLGLGLTVSQKIIESHRGKLMLGKNGNGHEGVVRISLPLGPK